MSAGKFELFQKKDCVQVDGNIVTAIETEVSISTADSILGKAIEKHPKTFPALTPNNASTVLVFHTESGTQTLAAIRKNPDVDALFPEQINGSTGGYLPPEHCSGSFKKALLTTLSQKLLLNNELLEKLKSESNDEGLKALNRLTLLHDAIATNDGWGSIIAVHAHEAWKMCVLTAVKHITCSDADLTQIQRDLALLMPIEKQRIESITPAGERPNLRTISNFQILKLAPIGTPLRFVLPGATLTNFRLETYQ